MAAYRRRKRKAPVWLSVIIIIIAIAYFVMDYMGYSINDLMSLFGPEKEPVEGQIIVHIIDVGQGDSILIETPDGYMLIDAGTSDSKKALKAYLLEQGVEEIEYFVVTHAHADHDGGAEMIFDEFEVKNIIFEDYGYTGKKKQMFAESGANIIDPELRDEYRLGDAVFTVLSSDIEDDTGDKNDYSVVLRLDYGESSFIFAGDATTYTEGIILQEFTTYELDCDFLKSGHHGSKTSSSVEFLEALTPDIVAISCGAGNSYGLLKNEIIERYEEIGAEIHRTDRVCKVDNCAEAGCTHESQSLVYVSDGKTIIYQGK